MNRKEGTRQSLSPRPSGRFTINEIQIFRRKMRIGGFGKVWNPPTTLSRAIWTLLSLKKVEPKERTQLNERTEATLYDTPAARDRRSLYTGGLQHCLAADDYTLCIVFKS